MCIPSLSEIWINFCDRAIIWLFLHSCKHRKPTEGDLFIAWMNYVGYDAYIRYGVDQPYKDHEA